jgi:hypothetical protein
VRNLPRTGTINWTATIADGNPDVDLRTARTQIVCIPGTGGNND